MNESDFNLNTKSERGAGTYGKIYEIEEIKTKMKFAMKVIQIHDVSSEELTKIQEETTLITNLSHPNIIKIFGNFVSAAADKYCVIMELAISSLDKEIAKWRNDPKLGSQPKILGYFTQILDAVNYCHQHNIIHRDLKPENIIMFKSGKSCELIPKLCDFGSATLMENRTKTMKSTGTMNYMAPEMLEGKGYSYPVDTWALGCILYEMVTTCQAFPGNSLSQIVNSIVKAKTDYNKISSSEIQQLIKKILNREVAFRIKIIQLINEPILQQYFQINNEQQQWRQMEKQRKLLYVNQDICVDIYTLTDVLYRNRNDLENIQLDCIEIIKKLTPQYLYEIYSKNSLNCQEVDFEGDPIYIILHYFTSDQFSDLLSNLDIDMKSNISTGEAFAIILYNDKMGYRVKYLTNQINNCINATYNQLNIYQCNEQDKQFIQSLKSPKAANNNADNEQTQVVVSPQLEEQKRQLDEQRKQIEKERRELDEQKSRKEKEERIKREDDLRKKQQDEQRQKEDKLRREKEDREREEKKREQNEDEQIKKYGMPIELRHIDKLEDDGVYIESVEKPNYYICIKDMNIRDASKWKFNKQSNGLMIINVSNQMRLSTIDNPSHKGSVVLASKDLKNCVWPLATCNEKNTIVMFLNNDFVLQIENQQLKMNDYDKNKKNQKFLVHSRSKGMDEPNFDPLRIGDNSNQEDIKRVFQKQRVECHRLEFQDKKIENTDHVYIFPYSKQTLALSAMGIASPQSQQFRIEKVGENRGTFTNVATKTRMCCPAKQVQQNMILVLSNELENCIFFYKEIKNDIYILKLDSLAVTVAKYDKDPDKLIPVLGAVDRDRIDKQMFIMMRGSALAKKREISEEDLKKLAEHCKGM